MLMLLLHSFRNCASAAGLLGRSFTFAGGANWLTVVMVVMICSFVRYNFCYCHERRHTLQRTVEAWHFTATRPGRLAPVARQPHRRSSAELAYSAGLWSAAAG